MAIRVVPAGMYEQAVRRLHPSHVTGDGLLRLLKRLRVTDSAAETRARPGLGSTELTSETTPRAPGR
ncbi:hypothetical protein ACIHFD_34965 [Nonomuraea sp. NPDC051941]|uniref:hypothetical protein n=1 Tax=Nonomuraea sp. NPDC051941 TaxID=3364373 RepID=UPI0037CB1CBE